MTAAGEPIDEKDVVVCFGLCCCNAGIATSKCLGVATEATCLCFEHNCCLKPGADCMWCSAGGGGGKICQLGLGICSIGLVTPSTCCKSQAQCCCLVESAALPPDSEIRAVIAILGLSLYPKCGCCIRLNDVGAPPSPELASGAPEGMEMTGRAP
eukprot:CAMPEP_0197387012 /NCGR_PEP_ID=MMETSP1165-20131217/270_1 /TAXON_ID=284809 /ORGANISM="Chrysocystis fragilis, Strain CCMP3189" /LENGTH=154 /DNA_ID=CAMNT_0042912309 /DNA_START=18 /DNA_END=482 /DNA_ORIENTATION=-